MLVRHLPPESATIAKLEGPAALWGVAEHLLAAAVNALRSANWQRAGDRKQPYPPMVDPPRPGNAVTVTARSTLTVEQKRARLVELERRAGRRGDGR